jgi:methionyl-tRNA synthetase
VYVWADALNNYITAIGYGADQSELARWWPADLQVMGKDIIRFHAVYWPAFLMATGLAEPRQLLVHGWFKVGEQKMSKSLGNAVDPFELARTYGADALRYYLVRHMAVTQDSPFSIEDLEKRINADLANDLGNLLNRMLTLAAKNNITTLPAPQQLSGPELDLRDKLWTMLNDFSNDMEEYYFHRAYAHVWKYINYVNAYFHAQEPWKVAATDPERFKAIISAVSHSLHAIGILVWPVMPSKMTDLLGALGVTLDYTSNHIERLSVDPWSRTFVLTPIPPLFNRIEPAVVQPQEAPPAIAQEDYITIDQLAAVKLCIGTIVSCEDVPKSDKLYKLEVDFGEQGMRQICSGIRLHFSKEYLIGKQATFVLNLAPRKLMGIESQGMMLLVEKDDGGLSLVVPEHQVPSGRRLR